MTLILCLDDRNGMLFQGRRQSRDRVLCQRILDIVGDGRLLMNAYSAKLFPKNKVTVAEDPAAEARSGDHCFVEDLDIHGCLSKANSLILYRWNRVYPSDVTFPEDGLAGYQLVESTEFPGSSHEKITQEVYKR